MRSKVRILLVEDDDLIRIGLRDVLVYHGYEVEAVSEGTQGLQKALHEPFDLILLDVMLPGYSGLDICEKVRERNREQLIILITAKVEEKDIQSGFMAGADDYITKPFFLSEVLLRVKAILRRSQVGKVTSSNIVLDHRVTIDLGRLAARVEDKEIGLTRREAGILEYLHVNRRPIARDELLERVWGYDQDVAIETRTVDIHIARLRKKLEIDLHNPRYIVTVRGVGYQLNKY